MKRPLRIAAVIFFLAGGLALQLIIPRDREAVRSSQRPSVPQDNGEDLPPLPRLPDRIEFRSQVAPIFAEHCLGCHSESKSEGNLRLDQRPVDHWQSAASELIRRVVSEDPEFRMPPDQRLAADEIEILRRWVDEGAYWPDPNPQTAEDWSEPERSHWAFRPLRKPAVPAVARAEWVRRPIDAFILAKLEEAGLTPPEPAPPRELIRRLCLSVTGLPPTIAQQERIQRMKDSGWDGLVDELLASSAYGEHWAKFWLDLVRYADTNGYEDDGRKPFAWKYRDFVIRSFNSDRPYDEFVRMQIAGDLLPEPGKDDFIAAGFLRLGAWDSEPDDELVSRFDQLDDMVSTTSLVFSGLTVGCARCHDHPLEPIASSDYYRVLANFHGLARPIKGRLEKAAPAATPEALAESKRVRQKRQELLNQAFRAEEAQAARLRRKAAALAKAHRFEPVYRFVETELSLKPTRLLVRGNPHRPGEAIPAGPLSLLAEQAWEEEVPARLQLANWLTTENQALTARVIVNRVWGWHFGRGVVATPSNLGQSGSEPSHPQLLEFLAHWFVHEADWSLKKLQRLILTSNTFRSRGELGLPASNRRRELFGVFPQQRLRAEVVYDSLLTVAGLRREKMYGPPEYPKLPEAVLGSLAEPGPWSDPTPKGRRAIYQVVKRNQPIPLLEAFNAPIGGQSCAMRLSNQTTTQALALWNGPFVEDCAQAFAKRIVQEAPADLDAQIDFAYRVALVRTPDASERQALRQFLGQDEAISLKDPDSFQALREMCRVILNLNEFVFLN